MQDSSTQLSANNPGMTTVAAELHVNMTHRDVILTVNDVFAQNVPQSQYVAMELCAKRKTKKMQLNQ